ncbi:MAG: transposase [Chloroflexi bacterium]|nr:transposase [Chloroflexota bacterium]MYE41818.1 transposase [Chloroflexota bacterium]
MQQATLQYRVHTSKAGHRRLEQALLDMGELYNALLLHRKAARGSHRGQFSLSAQTKAITQLRREESRYAGYAYRLLDRVVKQANLAWNAASRSGARPQAKSLDSRDSLEVSAPGKNHLRLTPDGRYATISIKGLPALKFKPDWRMPRDQQPRLITVVRKPRGLVVNLVFNRPEGPPVPAPEHSVGITPGVGYLLSASGSDGTALQVSGHDGPENQKLARRLRRKMQRQQDAALRDGRARWVSQKARDGRVKHRFRWNDRPSKSYLKCVARLRKVEQKRSDSLRGLHHRVSTALAGRYGTVCLEDAKIQNTTKPVRRTAENPGRNAQRKPGLNRRSLPQGWHLFRRTLEYKCQWQERRLVVLPVQSSPATCSKRNHADGGIDAAENIRRKGIETLASAGDLAGRAAGVPFGTTSTETPGPHCARGLSCA